MAMLVGQRPTPPLPPAPAARRPPPATAALSHDSELDSDTAPRLTPSELWVVDACRVELDKDGNVLTHIPALLAGAVSRLVEEAAAGAAARGAPHAAGTAPPPFAAATRLHGCRSPGISVEAYAARLLRYARCSPICFVAAFAYMRRLQTGGAGGRGGPLRVDGLTAHRLMATGLVVATKFFDDKYYSNGHYAQVAGVSLRELNAMEVDLLHRLGFRARCGLAELSDALAEMQSLAAGSAGHAPMLAAAAGLPGGAVAAAAAAAAGAAQSADTTIIGVASAAADGAEPDEFCSAATTVGAVAHAVSSAGGELASCGTSLAAAAAALPWAAARDAAAALAAEEDAAERTAPPRRSKKRCSIEAAHHGLLRGSLDERPLFAEPLCRA